MDYPKENSKSLYDYSDKSVQRAGYAAIAYAVMNLFGGVLALIGYFIYHTPGNGSVLPNEFAAQQYLQHTPVLTAVALGYSIIIALISGGLAVFIFRGSRFAVVAMLAMVVLLQLFTWFAGRSVAGSLVSIVVVVFLVLGAKRIFQDYAERRAEAATRV